MNKIKPAKVLIYIFNFIFGLAALTLFIRFLARLLNAEQTLPTISFLYNSTTPLLMPFQGIFGSYTIDGQPVIEFSTLIAVGIYLFLAWVIIEFIEYIEYSVTREV